jgi:hypothetical protein
MTSTPSAELYDATVPSAGFTIDTTAGPVDMVAVIYRLEGRKGLRLTRAELDVVEAVNRRYSELRPTLRRLPGDPKRIRIEVCRRLARELTDAA